ncbi:MAG: hypothetical protein AVDCRST_MAG67-67 [uncultured Solirubrobacteraceae bacterium]|uniref:DUF1707 domain-containing protein n=1 Tax=uncultured Solirubrobacteraceae bacterium TaxID=1162706 RepID=A0A6J4RFX2_9ACTN|nr:MAG: hypothetical protein AVDCRST_MAG67-67 [uncultured Solirubrobacteraceae bacterium]
MTADEHSQLRASDAERDWAVGIVREAAAEGRLALDELSDRVERALGATTRGELELVVRDLPAASPGAPQLMPTVGQAVVFGDVRVRARRPAERLIPRLRRGDTRG